ncbi:hypothetical protein PybrP1_006605 [[Pythium] brassicae (nom. inval.)]|nr:hypothetical protein PybrP1_006605 [[Pythium] brassicae (nom. inval.)]
MAAEEELEATPLAGVREEAEPDAPWSVSNTRERIAGSPLVPGGVQWSADGRVAVVSDANVLIATFMSRELELFVREGPAVSKSFVFLTEDRAGERVPLPIPAFSEVRQPTPWEPVESAVGAGSLTYFLLHESERHQFNPKELSLSKNDGRAFLSATWGPRGSGPNASCALLTLTSASRIGLHFASSFHMSWKEVSVVSETLFDFFEKAEFTMRRSKQSAKDHAASATKKRRLSSAGAAAVAASSAGSASRDGDGPTPRSLSASGSSVADYAHRCGLLATLSIAWSPFVRTQDHETTSLIAFAGRKVATVWGYVYPTFSPDHGADGPFLAPSPMAWVDTERHGWVSTSTWQQMRADLATPTDRLTLALGTTAGSVLLAHVPVCSQLATSGFPPEVAVHRTVVAPHCQPVFNICLGSRAAQDEAKRGALVVASGSTISVWNLRDDRAPPRCWRAHEGNITGLDTNYFGDTLFSCGVDGALKVWETETGTEVPFRVGAAASGKSGAALGASGGEGSGKYPLFGLAVSPSSAQIACVHIIPPAARPNRKSQADVSYSRVSSALEYLPSPDAKDPDGFVRAMCRVLEDCASVSSFTDVLWFCYEDNAAVTSLHGSVEMTIPNLLSKLKGGSEANGDKSQREPLYLRLCESLERKSTSLMAAEADGAAVAHARVRVGAGGKQPLSAILYLQASYLLRSCIPPGDDHVAIRDEALARLRRSLYGYWAERCLNELVATHSQVENFADTTATERTSALLMADFLSVQSPLSATREQLVTTVYTRLDSDANQSQWLAHLQALRATSSSTDTAASDPAPIPSVAPTPPPRQTCFICDQPVPFGEFALACASGHAQERCFLSFQVVSATDAWRCMGCGASACEIDFSAGGPPFFLLAAAHDTSRLLLMGGAGSGGDSAASTISCRLCGNFCSFFKY